MMDIPVEAVDASRLSALRDYDILDTPPEQGFDDAVLLARQICEAPVALVSLVASDRQWFKARIGFEPHQTPIGESVCAYALGRPDILVIPDLTADERTRENALVTGGPRIRFYAGAPLRTPEGRDLGTICVIDAKPRPDGLSDAQAIGLRALARQVMGLLELRRTVRDRDAALARHHASQRQHEAFVETRFVIAAAAGSHDAILDAVVGGSMRAIAAAEGGTVITKAGPDAVFRSSQGRLAPFAGLRFPLKGSLAGSCILSGEPALCPDSALDVRVDHVTAARIGFKSCVLLPLSRHGEVIAALMLQSSMPNAFTDHDLQVARLFAGAATSAFAEAAEAAALRSVEASDARTRAVFDSAIEYAIIVMDLEGIVTDWSEGARRILGWTREEIRGRRLDVFFTPEDRADGVATKEMQRALAVGRGADERWHIRKDGSRFWAIGEMMALRDEAGVAIGFVEILRDRSEQRAAVARLAASEANLRTIVETVPVGILLAEAPSGRIVRRNRRMDEIVGPASGSSKAIHNYGDWLAYHPDGRRVEASEYPLARVLRENVANASLELQYQRRDGSRVWLELAAAPVRDAEGNLDGAVVVVSDIGPRKNAEAMRSLMNNELSHRMKNLMAMVLAVVNSTMRNAEDVQAVRSILNERLIAMSKAHEILVDGAMKGSSLAAIVRGGTDVHADQANRFTLSGPDVRIGAVPALALAMMMHELSTNAAKYGALSSETGHVTIGWSLAEVAGKTDLRIEWRERGGPTIVPPTQKGFGSRLIERGLTGHVGGTVSTDYAPSGLVCVVQAPLAAFQADDVAAV